MGAPCAFDQRHPAMAAGVAEYPCTPVAATDREQRHPEAVTFDMIPRVWDGRRWHEHAGKRTQQTHFIRKPSWVDVIVDRFAPHLALIGRARVEMTEHAVHDLHIVCDQRLCRASHGVCRAGLFNRSHNEASRRIRAVRFSWNSMPEMK